MDEASHAPDNVILYGFHMTISEGDLPHGEYQLFLPLVIVNLINDLRELIEIVSRFNGFCCGSHQITNTLLADIKCVGQYGFNCCQFNLLPDLV